MKIQISNGMFMALIINLIYAKAIGLTQGSMAREIGNDMWVATFLSILQGLVIMFITIKVLKRTPEHNVMQQSAMLMGKWAGKFVALLLFLFLTAAYGAVLATFVYHLNDYFLPDAPILVFVLIALLVGIYATFFRIGVIGRMALIGVLSLFLLNILILMGSISYFDIRELMPVLETGIGRTAWASRFHNTDWAIATIMAAILLPNVKDKGTWGSSGIMGLVFSGFMVILWPILEAGVLTAGVTGDYIISCMQMARSAEIGYFLHRYEMIMIAFFALSTFTQIMILYLCASVCVKELFNLKDFRPAVIPSSLILSALGYLLVTDHGRSMIFIEKYWVIGCLVFAIPFPIILWILGSIFKKKLKKKKLEAQNKNKGQ